MVDKTLVRLAGRANSLARSIEPQLDQMLATPWVSYALICALQFKILWGIWWFRDLTAGDTSSYFAMAYRWYEDFAVNIVWSPLYTAFYGTVYLLTHDVYTATILHRVIIVMAASLGILALMRQLLPPAIALLIAAWWAVLPINFDTLYEVHLFGLLPILAAWLVTTVNDTPWTRGIALAILIATTILVRNEQIVSVIVFAAICAAFELRNWRREGEVRKTFFRSRLAGYGLPFSAAILLSCLFYFRSYITYPQIIVAINAKHALNMCQVYAFGYSQRHPTWGLSPWVECQPLLQSVFGRGMPTLAQMIFSNPHATLNSFLWNASLTLNGIQAALFNRMSGSVNPDYKTVIRNVFVAFVLSTIALAIVITGANKIVREWKYWWSAWLSSRRVTFLIMLSELLVSVPVVLTQRPRPSYLFPTTAIIMMIIGMSVFVLLGSKRLIVAKILAAVTVPLLLIAVPSYYVKYKSERPLYANITRLQQFDSFMDRPENRILFGDHSEEYRGYLHFTSVQLATFDYSILSEWHAPESLDQFLTMRGINIVFIQPPEMPALRARPEARKLLEDPQSVGWVELAPRDGETDWILLYREPHA